MRKKTDLIELQLLKQHIVHLKDCSFNANNVCIVTGAASGIGRATAIAAAANKLMTVGIDMDGEGGKETQCLAREIGGQMIFIETDYHRDDQLEHAVYEAAKMGEIKYLATLAIETGTSRNMEGPREEQILLMSSRLSELAMAYMLKNSDGSGVIGSLAWWPENSAPPLPGPIQELSPRPDIVDSLTGSKNPGISFFSINLLDGGALPVPEPGQADGGTDCSTITMDNLCPHLLDIANLFIYGFSRYAGCLVKKELFLRIMDGKSRCN